MSEPHQGTPAGLAGRLARLADHLHGCRSATLCLKLHTTHRETSAWLSGTAAMLARMREGALALKPHPLAQDVADWAASVRWDLYSYGNSCGQALLSSHGRVPRAEWDAGMRAFRRLHRASNELEALYQDTRRPRARPGKQGWLARAWAALRRLRPRA
jgi:hypothetical protein